MLQSLIEVLESGVIQVRKVVTVGATTEFSHYTIVPGQDFSAENDRVKSICAVVHTPEVITAYQAVQEAAKLSA
jgi:hypothetical protein